MTPKAVPQEYLDGSSSFEFKLDDGFNAAATAGRLRSGSQDLE
jgi:hypothetical protein